MMPRIPPTVATIPGYSATTGWDPITGIGTPNAANLVPDLVAAAHGVCGAYPQPNERGAPWGPSFRRNQR
jgi:hypothetical protein